MELISLILLRAVVIDSSAAMLVHALTLDFELLGRQRGHLIGPPLCLLMLCFLLDVILRDSKRAFSSAVCFSARSLIFYLLSQYDVVFLIIIPSSFDFTKVSVRCTLFFYEVKQSINF